MYGSTTSTADEDKTLPRMDSKKEVLGESKLSVNDKNGLENGANVSQTVKKVPFLIHYFYRFNLSLPLEFFCTRG